MGDIEQSLLFFMFSNRLNDTIGVRNDLTGSFFEF